MKDDEQETEKLKESAKFFRKSASILDFLLRKEEVRVKIIILHSQLGLQIGTNIIIPLRS
jgi:hypothetical protein